MTLFCIKNNSGTILLLIEGICHLCFENNFNCELKICFPYYIHHQYKSYTLKLF